MKKRSLSLPVVVLITVVALALGSFGTATAAGLTSKQVKKIAAKVVKKKAGGLSVASAQTAVTAGTAATATNATNAGNAATVGGKTPAQLQTTGYRFTLPVVDPLPTVSFAFPGLPAGTYLVSYSLTAITNGPTDTVYCGFRSTPTSPNDASSKDTAISSFAALQSSGIVSVAAGSVLRCTAPSGLTAATTDANIGRVSFVPIATLAGTGLATGS